MLKRHNNSDDNDIHLEDIEEKEESKKSVDSSQNAGYNDDIKIEGEESEKDVIKTLRKKLKDCQKERGEYLNGWQRSKADLINARKTFEEEKKEYISFAKEDVLGELLPVIDSFDMAFANKESWESVDKNWRTGVEYIYSQFVTVLENNGLVQINPLGERFDPGKHTSVKLIETTKEEDADCISEVVRKGYCLHDKIVRSPKVKVFSYKKKSQD